MLKKLFLNYRMSLILSMISLSSVCWSQKDSVKQKEWYDQLMELSALTDKNPQEASEQFDQFGQFFNQFSDSLRILYLEQQALNNFRMGHGPEPIHYQVFLNLHPQHAHHDGQAS